MLFSIALKTALFCCYHGVCCRKYFTPAQRRADNTFAFPITFLTHSAVLLFSLWKSDDSSNKTLRNQWLSDQHQSAGSTYEYFMKAQVSYFLLVPVTLPVLHNIPDRNRLPWRPCGGLLAFCSLVLRWELYICTYSVWDYHIPIYLKAVIFAILTSSIWVKVCIWAWPHTEHYLLWKSDMMSLLYSLILTLPHRQSV